MDPSTGQVASGSTGNGSDPGVNPDVMGTVTDVAAYRQPDLASSLAPIVVLELLALIAIPPAVYAFMVRRRRMR